MLPNWEFCENLLSKYCSKVHHLNNIRNGGCSHPCTISLEVCFLVIFFKDVPLRNTQSIYLKIGLRQFTHVTISKYVVTTYKLYLSKYFLSKLIFYVCVRQFMLKYIHCCIFRTQIKA